MFVLFERTLSIDSDRYISLGKSYQDWNPPQGIIVSNKLLPYHAWF